MAIDVLIVDGQRLTLEGMRFALERTEDINVIGIAVSASELLAALKRSDPDVVLMDADLHDMDGLKCLDIVRRNYPQVKVGMLFAGKDIDRIETALESGAAACVMKNVRPEDLASAVRQAVEATIYTAFSSRRRSLEPAGTYQIGNAESLAELTERELTMLHAIARGLSNKAIGKELWVTEQTVKFHLNNVYRKLGVPNRTAAARYAFEHGLADAPLAGRSL